jgi:hypothetical protein
VRRREQTAGAAFTVARDGFHGALYEPAVARYGDKALVVFSGSDGRFSWACALAEGYRDLGVAFLALGYWNVPGLPRDMAAIPVESVEREHPAECAKSRESLRGETEAWLSAWK